MDLHKVRLDPECYIAPNCTLLGDVTIGTHSSVFPGVVMRGDRAPITIGEKSNIQENCVLHVDFDLPCTIGDNVTVGHNAIVHCATIGDNTIVGMGSVVLDGAVIGKECVIGAGAVVPKGMVVPDGSLVLGVPAKVKGPISEEQRAYNQTSADDYEANARELAELKFFYTGANVPEDIPHICLEPRYHYGCFR